MKTFKLILLILLSLNSSAQATIRIVCTAALPNNKFYNYRKKQYHKAFTILSNMGYRDLYIVEALKKRGPTFLDKYSKNVFYALSNNPKYKNYGINEAKTLLELIQNYKFDPEDMIIKVTGRYQLISDHLLKFTRRHMQYDAIVKFNKGGNVFTSAFAMKCKHLVKMIESLDYDQMEEKWIILEEAVARYINQQIADGTMNVYQINHLGIKADFYGSSAPGGTGIEIQ